MRLICSLIGSTVTRKKINMICNDSCSKPVVDSGTLPTGSRVEKEIEEGSVDDVEAENIEKGYGWPIERQILVYRRLYKKRANMALVHYHKSHPVSTYSFFLAYHP